MTDATLSILYSCPLCRLRDATVEVRLRRPDEDVVAWMKEVVEPGLVRDHRSRSPSCTAPSARDVKIPLTGRQYIGGPAEH